MSVFIKGFLLSLSMIVAIGAQNAFVIKQGILKNHIFMICSIFFLSDALLIILGVYGVGEWLAKNSIFNITISAIGVIFTFIYGLISLKAAVKSSSKLELSKEKPASLSSALLVALGVTYLNPQVYLETIFIIGASALPFSEQRLMFAGGAISASFLWFYTLGYGAKALSNQLKKPAVLRMIDFFVAAVMFGICYGLLSFIIQNFQKGVI